MLRGAKSLAESEESQAKIHLLGSFNDGEKAEIINDPIGVSEEKYKFLNL